MNLGWLTGLAGGIGRGVGAAGRGIGAAGRGIEDFRRRINPDGPGDEMDFRQRLAQAMWAGSGQQGPMPGQRPAGAVPPSQINRLPAPGAPTPLPPSMMQRFGQRLRGLLAPGMY